jgi:hypothetical protein
MNTREKSRENYDPTKHAMAQTSKHALMPHAAGAFQTKAPAPHSLPAPPARWSGSGSEPPTTRGNVFACSSHVSMPLTPVVAAQAEPALTPRTAEAEPQAPAPALVEKVKPQEQFGPTSTMQLSREQRRLQRRREKTREKTRGRGKIHGAGLAGLAGCFGLKITDHSSEGWTLISSLLQLPVE